MPNLDSLHLTSLTISLIFSLLLHASLLGYSKNWRTNFILIALFPFILMGLTLILPQWPIQIIAYGFFIAGIGLFARQIPMHSRNVQQKWTSISGKEKWCVSLLGIYLFSFFMTATIIKDSGGIQDALVYHLAGPKEWALYLNGAKFNPNNPIAYTASYFEYFYYYIILILKPIYVKWQSLPTTQYEFLSYTIVLTAQIFIGIFALLHVPLLIIRISSSIGIYKYLAVVFIYGLRLLTWSWMLPKNDIFPLFCYLISLEIFIRHYVEKNSNSNWSALALAALVAGIGTASKLTNAYILIFSLLFLVSFYYRETTEFTKGIKIPKAILIVGLGLFVGSIIFLVRNFLQTGNPFYPIDKFGFENIYLSAYAYRPNLYYMPIHWGSALLKIKAHILDQPQLLIILFIALFSKARSLSLFYVFTVVFMAKQNGRLFAYRMTVIYLVLALILFILIIKEQQRFKFLRVNKVVIGLIVLSTIIFSKFQPEKLIKYPITHYGQEIGFLIKDKVNFWEMILKDNLENTGNKNYVFFPEKEIFPFFSRFPFVSRYDSVPQYRYEYKNEKN